MIADVDEQNMIVRVIFEDSFPVPYQASLENSYDGSFDEEIRDLGMRTFREIKEIAENYQVAKIAAVATAAFRQANNGELFAEAVEEETSIPLHVISQREEGTLAFFSGVALGEHEVDNLIVWDIGTGSFQMTAKGEEEELSIFMGALGSVPFRNYIIDVVQEKDSYEIQTPNPMTKEDVKQADSYARSIGRKAYPLIKDKIKEPNTVLLGIGRLFFNSIGPMGDENAVISRSDLRAFIAEAVGHTDEELNNPYANVDVSNAILVLAFMKALHIHEIHTVNTTSTRGVLVYPSYW